MNRATIFLVPALLFAGAASAQEELAECEIRSTSVYFGNGINTSRYDANLSNVYLRTAYRNRLEETYPEEAFEFKVAYNPTYGFVADVSEVFLQTASAEDREVLSQLGSTQLEALFSMSRARYDALAESIRSRFSGVVTDNRLLEFFSIENQNALRQEVLEAATRSLESAGLATAVLAAETNEVLTQLYRNDLDAGQRVIVVSHSQGNLFARDNIGGLLSSNPEYSSSVGSVGVATPSNMQPRNDPYVTADDDRVIDGLRVSTAIDGIAGNEPLSSNLDNDPSVIALLDPRDFLNHGFLPSYFDPRLDSRARIDSMFFDLIGSLAFPDAVVGNGAIRVTLEWGAEPDVDLHAYEPDGSHVFYANLTGSAGTLDRDDVTSFGPENYFVPCETLAAGVYGFGVNYFRGSAPEIASVTVRVGDGQSSSASIPLQNAIGSSGNLPPVSLSVSVTQDDTGKFSYELIDGAVPGGEQIVRGPTPDIPESRRK